MASFSPKALKMMKAIEEYTKTYKRFDTLQVLNRVKITSAKEGTIAGTFVISEDICNIAKTVHGGFLTSVIDAFALFGIAHHEKGAFAFTTDMSIFFLNKGQMGDRINVEAKPIAMTKKRAVMECILTNQENGHIIAKCLTGFSLINVPAAFTDTIKFDPVVDND